MHRPEHSNSTPTVWVSIGLLLLAGALALAKALGEGPAHLQSAGQVTVVYAAARTYQYAAFPVTAGMLLMWALVAKAAASGIRQTLRRRASLVALGLSSVAVVWAGLSTLPQLFVGYEHVAGVTVGADDYHVGVRTALDGDDFYIVSVCPHGQWRCTAYGVAPVGIDERPVASRVRLSADVAGQGVVIVTPARSLPFTPFPARE